MLLGVSCDTNDPSSSYLTIAICSIRNNHGGGSAELVSFQSLILLITHHGSQKHIRVIVARDSPSVDGFVKRPFRDLAAQSLLHLSYLQS